MYVSKMFVCVCTNVCVVFVNLSCKQMYSRHVLELCILYFIKINCYSIIVISQSFSPLYTGSGYMELIKSGYME
uniref:Uncharacterized protein n=1 Tax=Octopus bimaculoides TaxID=37653 RepID=A0A0L8G7Q3_OCTBM